ncbi:MAG: WecB/TagA/CpsF family glycosyltransferase [Bacteroidota bacterium]|nr:MAG: WecB/TagA/CpsF family glycosyltransferase [Bacteroidota bacterium]
MQKTSFYNLSLNILDTPKCLEICSDFLMGKQCRTLFFINAHCFNMAQKNEAYKICLDKADLVLNDGIGIELAARYSGISLPENMNGTDLIPKIIEMAYNQNKKFFLLGGQPGVIEKTKEVLEKKHPGIKIVGSHSGYFDSAENEKIITEINNSQANLLIVGMGVPRQEIWIMENLERFNQLKLAIGGGAIVDFIAGKVKRAPLWIQKIKMEWFYRFIHEPKRLFKRYFVGNFVFFMYIIRLKYSVKNQ